MIYAIACAFKSTHTQALFGFLQNLNLYNYHHVQYDGVLKSVLNFSQFVQEKEWDLIPIDGLQNKFDSFWFTNNNQYVPFTDIAYLEVERRDLSFL